jgi:hypothetical protein
MGKTGGKTFWCFWWENHRFLDLGASI